MKARRRKCATAIVSAFCLLICTPLSFPPTRGSARAAPRASYRTSWIGNSFPGGITNGRPGTGKKVQSSTADMSVRPDGTVFLNTIWDESGQEGGRYKDGTVLGGSPCAHDGGGLAITTNSKYAYLSYQLFAIHSTNGVRRYDLNGNPAGGFKGATGKCGNELVVPTHAYIPGLAASDSELYVADESNGLIRVYRTDSMVPLRLFRFPHPLKLAYHAITNTLWIAHKGGIDNYSTTGKFLGRRIEGIADPGGLAINNHGQILVADMGPQQRIRIYSETGRFAGTFGNGIYSAKPGEVRNAKLVNPVAVGSDDQGNVYVAGGNGITDLRKFSAVGKMLWGLRGLVFIDTAAADNASDGRDVYTALHHFRMNYATSAGEEWNWTGYTINPFKYPGDPRLFVKSPTVHSLRNLNGRKYLFTTDQFSHTLLIFRLDGEIAVPAGGFGGRPIEGWAKGIQPYRYPWSPAWMWSDSNGNASADAGEFTELDGVLNDATWGWDVDSLGNVWAANNDFGLVQFPLRGWCPGGAPLYAAASAILYGRIAPFTAIERVVYLADSDTLYLSGYTQSHPRSSHEPSFGLAGTELARYDGFLAGNHSIPRYRIALPYNPLVGQAVKAIAVAGNRIVAGVLQSSGTSFKKDAEDVFVYDAGSGALLGRVLPGAEVGNAMGWLDCAHGLSAYRRADGEYLVFEEEVYWNKVLMFRGSLDF